jgi:hypothetical protein
MCHFGMLPAADRQLWRSAHVHLVHRSSTAVSLYQSVPASDSGRSLNLASSNLCCRPCRGT